VGREAELTELGTALEDSLAGHGRAVFVSGEPGIGKSRLADELAARARQRGAHVLVGRCWEAGGAPAYWPWVQALRAYLREGDLDSLRPHLSGEGADVATILPELRELVPDLPAPLDAATEGARFRLLESIASFLRRAAASRPLVLFFDDLHAADATSLLVLRFVAGQLSDTPILIVGSYRDTEVGPDLAEALAELGREPAVRRLALKGLDESITSQLLEAVMGEEPAGDLAAQVQAETQGNPLFAGEIGRLLASEGSPADGRRGLPIPEGVRETIRRRLGRQSERCREVLTLASVVGREFDPEVIGRVGDIGEDELYDVLDEAAAARLVGAVAEAGPRLRFSHILIRDALYRDLRVPQRIRLHRAVAEALDALYAGNAEPHLAELAHHYLEGGTAVAARAIEYAQRAGDRAASQHGYEEAARHYTSALELIERTGSDDEGRPCELLLSLGEALSRAGGEREARDALLRAASLAEKAGRPDQLARAALEYGGRFAWARASTDPAMVPLLERALIASGGEDSPTRVRLLARLASAARDEPTRDRRVGLAKECLSSAKRLGDPVTLAFALDGYWTAVEGPHNHAEGIAAGAQLIALGEQVGDSERVFAGHDHRLHLFWQLADRGGVEYELEALNVLADDLRQPAQQWHVGTGATMVALMEGRFERAEELISQTAELGSRTESWNALVSQRLALFTLRHAQGRLAEHVDTIARSVHEYPALQRFRCALVHAYAELDRRRDCRVAFDRLLSGDLGNEYVDAEWLFSMSLLADPCAYLGDRDAAGALYALLLPHERHYAQAPVETVFGSLARGLGVLAATLERLDEAERHFEVAIETERSMRAPPWRAHAEHGLAATLLARGGAGDVERSGTLLDEALATYREHGMRGWAERAAALRESAAVG
jgi:tetratricopeptide (TPR) repeat protein